MEIMDIHSACWLAIAVISFIAGLFLDEEMRKEFRSVRFCACMIFTLIALYWAIMWIAREWVTWCL